MSEDYKAKKEEANITNKDTPDTGLWIKSIWKFFRSLAFTIAGGTIIYLVCKWLIGK